MTINVQLTMSDLQRNTLDEELLQTLVHQHDPAMQQRAMVYLDHLKSSEVGWQMCMTALTNDNNLDDRVQFLCFQVIEYYLKNKYAMATPTEQQLIKEFLSRWIQLQCLPREQPTPSFIKNKAAQIFSLVFMEDYPRRWMNFFGDLIDTLHLGPTAVDNFIRVLKAIDSEVAGREPLYTQEEAERNTLIKDTIRKTCVVKLVESWYEIMKSYEVSHPQLTSQCLEVVGAYVSWIDISLIANAQFINLLLHLLRIPMIREATADCLHEIISKGMEPLDKARLIDELVPMLESGGFLVPLVEDETEYTCKMSRLVNGIGLSLLEAHTKLLKNGHLAEAKCLSYSIEKKVPFMLSFLRNDYDDVSSAVIEFCKEYLHYLKSKGMLIEQDLSYSQTLLFTIIHKMKYSGSYRFDQEGEDEAEFLEFRKLLKVIFDNLVALNKDMVLESISKFSTGTLLEWQVSPLEDVEVAITLLYLIGELIPAASDQNKILPVLNVLVTCGVSAHPHPVVTLQYLETVVRYEKMLLSEPEHLPSLLQTFLDHRGMRNPSCKVRSRCAYLLCKFIKFSKSHIQAFTRDVLVPLQDLLILKMPENGIKQEWVSQDDQLYLYEAAGVLIVCSSFTVQEKVLSFQELLSPVLDSFNRLLNEIINERDEREQEKLAGCMCHAMAVTSRTSKAFCPQQSMKSCGCVPVFLGALQVFLRCLEVPTQTSMFQSSIRQFLHRMVVCLGEEILPYIPQASHSLLKSNDIRSIQEYLPLIIQIVTKFKKEVVPFLQQIFMPIITAIFTFLANPIDEADEESKLEKQLLRRNYFQFLATIVINNVTEVLISQESQFMEQVMMSIIQGAVDFPDPVAQKSCFSIFKKLVDVWGGRAYSDGFVQFLYKHIIPACFEAPLKNTFDLSDAQTVLVLGESAACLKMILDRRGDEFVDYLKTKYLPSIQVSQQQIEEYCCALRSDTKDFKNYLKVFFETR